MQQVSPSKRCDDGVVSIKRTFRAFLRPQGRRYCTRWQYDICVSIIVLNCQRSRDARFERPFGRQTDDKYCFCPFVSSDARAVRPYSGIFLFWGCVFRLFFVILWLVFYNGLLCLNICI